jgi:hypothetical protein
MCKKFLAVRLHKIFASWKILHAIGLSIGSCLRKSRVEALASAEVLFAMKRE